MANAWVHSSFTANDQGRGHVRLSPGQPESGGLPPHQVPAALGVNFYAAPFATS
ncbi:hypothetical protein J6590_100405, partial [Homalodisca vitripennis]